MNEITMSYPMMKKLLKNFIDKDYVLYWRYEEEKIYLVFDCLEVYEEISFIKSDNNNLLLQKDSVSQIENEEIKYILFDLIGQDGCKSKKHIKLEIDYHLMELYDYIQSSNDELIHKTKDRLKELSEYLQER